MDDASEFKLDIKIPQKASKPQDSSKIYIDGKSMLKENQTRRPARSNHFSDQTSEVSEHRSVGSSDTQSIFVRQNARGRSSDIRSPGGSAGGAQQFFVSNHFVEKVFDEISNKQERIENRLEA